MDKPDEKGSQAKGAGGESNPMAMGMAMAKKMMSQMGAGGSPMEMMQKMMGQMRQGRRARPGSTAAMTPRSEDALYGRFGGKSENICSV